MTTPPDSYLDLYIFPLQPYLTRRDVTDIYINRPGEVWIETLGGQVECCEAPALDEAYLWRLARQIASQSNQGVNPRHPLLAATLPDGSRVQIVAPPATRGGMAVAIRRHAALDVKLESYRAEPIQRVSAAASPSNGESPMDFPAILSQAVRSRKNILISGGTSSGKTTLLNSLLSIIPSSERIILIEDTPELHLTHRNSVGLVAVRGDQGEARLTFEDLLQAALRMRPDRIILGELRGPEAFTFLRAINTGHPGSLSTIHADSPDRAFVQLAMMALQLGLGVSYSDLCTIVRQMIDVVVQVERTSSGRRITDLVMRDPAWECRDVHAFQ